MLKTRVRGAGTVFIGVVVIACACVTGVAQYRLLTRLNAIEATLAELRQQRPSRPVTAGAKNAPGEPVSLNGAVISGNQHASVAVIEYLDFQCPYCAKFAQEAWPELKRSYVDDGRVMWVVRHLPLTQIHPGAQKAAEAAECAARQGEFWEMQRRLFDNSRHLDATSIQDYAAQIHLDGAVFSRCMRGEVAGKIASDEADARRLDIQGTPTFLIGSTLPDGRVRVLETIVGIRSSKDFADVLDRALVTASSH